MNNNKKIIKIKNNKLIITEEYLRELQKYIDNYNWIPYDIITILEEYSNTLAPEDQSDLLDAIINLANNYVNSWNLYIDYKEALENNIKNIDKEVIKIIRIQIDTYYINSKLLNDYLKMYFISDTGYILT